MFVLPEMGLTVRYGMQELFRQNLFLYYYWTFKKLVVFHEIVRNIYVYLLMDLGENPPVDLGEKWDII
jgi:hypothetical protein